MPGNTPPPDRDIFYHQKLHELAEQGKKGFVLLDEKGEILAIDETREAVVKAWGKLSDEGIDTLKGFFGKIPEKE